MQQHGTRQKHGKQRTRVPRRAKTLRRVSRRFAGLGLLLGVAVAPLMAQTAALNVPWAPLAPQSLTTAATGAAGGRVLSVAVDPADASGNTVYIGTTGGVFKATNAAASGAAFVPLTDRVPAVDVAHEHINLVNVGAVSVQPGGTHVVLAGTGDPTNEPDSLYGTGILRSADGGNSWTTIMGSRDLTTGLEQNSFFGEAFSGFAWSTTMPNLVVAAVTTAPGASRVNAGHSGTGDNSATGLYYSEDAGKTWQLATIEDGPLQVLQAPGQQTGAVALAVVWNPIRRIFMAALRNHGFYSSQDGAGWTRLQNQPGTALTLTACPSSPGGSPNCPIYSAALAVQPGSGDMFAMALSQANADSGLWEDVCGAVGGTCSTPLPVFGKRIGNAALETSTGVIAGASHALWLDAIPSGNDTLLFAGTQDLFRCSLAAGCVWRNATNVNGCAKAQVGANQHDVAWVANTGTLYFANDRGLWRTKDAVNQQQAACSADDAAHFDNLNASLGALVEVTSLAQDPVDSSELLAGMGAAGTAGGSDGAWQLLLNGLGGGTAVGWGVNTGTWFATSGAGVSISSCTAGAGCGPLDFGSPPAIGNGQVSGDGSALSAPAVWTLDPEDPSRMLVATCRLWRGASDGTGWTAANQLSKMLDGNNAPACRPSNTQVRALAATGAISGRGDQAERIYVGLAGVPDGSLTHPGHVLTALVTPSSVASTMTWSDVTGSTVTNDSLDSGVFNRAGVGISAIAVDLTDTTGKTVYVGIAGFGGQGFAALPWANVPVFYRSTDAGVHWQNLTNNLPNAPVNAVLVDPEDPAIVYVGTDVGVYVTTSVAQCADVRQDCWSAYGAGLPAVRVTTLSAVNTSGEKWLRVGTKGRGVWQAELASQALKATTATATIGPATLNFASQAVGTASGAESLTIRNTGAVALTLAAPTATNSDFILSNQCPASLAPGASCAISIVFAPTATGLRSTVVTVVANVQGGVLTANLQGTATPESTIVLTPLRLDFGSVRIGQTSPVQYVTVANTGRTVAGLKPLSISGPFTISANTCGSTLAVNTSCTVGVVFSPKVSGVATGSLVATDDAGTQIAFLSGNGQTGPTDALSATALTFAAQAIGTTSAAQQVTVTNTGDSALTNIKVQVTGDFAVTNLCGISLPGHSTCALQVVYSPKAVGAERGQMTIQDALGAQLVALSGTGTPPATGSGITATLSPLTIDFGIQGVNSISSPQLLTVINTGTNALSGISVAASQGFAIANNACTVTVAPGASCTVAVTFAPQVTGTQEGTVQVTASGVSAPLNVPVTGAGADFQLSVQGASSSIVTGGSSATYQLLLTPVGASAGQITFTCRGAPVGSTCATNPPNVAMTGTGATATIQVTVAAAANAHAAPAAPRMMPWNGKSAAGAVLACCLVLWRRRGWAASLERWRMLLVLGALCLGLTGCGLSINGGGPTGSGDGSGGQGVYTITVAGGAPGVSHAVTLKLTVE
jgi:large repetitive protein